MVKRTHSLSLNICTAIKGKTTKTASSGLITTVTEYITDDLGTATIEANGSKPSVFDVDGPGGTRLRVRQREFLILSHTHLREPLTPEIRSMLRRTNYEWDVTWYSTLPFIALIILVNLQGTPTWFTVVAIFGILLAIAAVLEWRRAKHTLSHVVSSLHSKLWPSNNLNGTWLVQANLWPKEVSECPLERVFVIDAVWFSSAPKSARIRVGRFTGHARDWAMSPLHKAIGGDDFPHRLEELFGNPNVIIASRWKLGVYGQRDGHRPIFSD